MTEEEKKELRTLKLRCSERLQAGIDNYTKKYSYALVGTDRRLLDYVICTAKNPNSHNLYELLGVERFFSYWDATNGKLKEYGISFAFMRL